VNKLSHRLLPALLIAASMTACTQAAPPTVQQDPAPGKTVTATTVSAVTPQTITYDSEDEDAAWEAATATLIELTGTSASGNGTGVAVTGSTVTILSPGVYVLSGTLSNGQVIVDGQTKGTVRLVLNGAEIHSESGPAIWVKNAGKAIVTLAQGTQNKLSDGAAYAVAGAQEDAPTAALFSKDDLTINGAGMLTVRANFKDGITSKDELVITGGNIAVMAKDDALIGRDSVVVKQGSFAIEAGGDGIKTTNDTDPAKAFIVIDGGTFEIKAAKDGIQAISDLTINNGTIKLDAGDDALNAGNILTIAGGETTLTAGDDGLHADASLVIKGGKTTVADSYEGVESAMMTISGGEVRISSKDDGINVAGTNPTLQIDGGYVAVNSAGDGVDVNGTIKMTDGVVVVSGPTANMNGSLDYDRSFEMTGGFLVAAGSAGMAQAPGAQSTQHAVMMNYSKTQAAGTLVSLLDSQGKPVVAFAPAKQYQTVVVSSPALKKGETYTFYTGGTATGKLTDGLYTDGTYQGGAKVVGFTIADIVTYMTESGPTTAPSGRGGGARQQKGGAVPAPPQR